MPFLTSMFLHGGWLHLIGNMWFLWVFGDNVEDRLGHISYLCFYLFCGFGSGLAHVMMNLGSGVPSLGASGAISGVLGAYIVLYPRAKVLTLVPLIVFWFTVDLPAYVILGYWFVIQFVAGIGAVGKAAGGGVAYWAHIGGFVLGVAVVKIWPDRPQRPRYSAAY
jgi:rhomboid family protein